MGSRHHATWYVVIPPMIERHKTNPMPRRVENPAEATQPEEKSAVPMVTLDDDEEEDEPERGGETKGKRKKKKIRSGNVGVSQAS